MIDGTSAMLGVYAAAFGFAALSGVIPLLNAEVYLVGAVLVMGKLPAAVALGVVVAAGQMVAKAGIYHAVHGATNLAGRRKHARGLERARALAERWRDRELALVFVSSSVGLPPFYVVSILAGALEVPFKKFMALGFVGRSIRFVAIAVAAAAF